MGFLYDADKERQPLLFLSSDRSSRTYTKICTQKSTHIHSFVRIDTDTHASNTFACTHMLYTVMHANEKGGS